MKNNFNNFYITNSLCNKLNILIKDIMSIEGINLKPQKKFYTEDKASILLTGKMDEETEINIMIKLNKIKENK
jgi:hypothetical protein